MDLAKFVDKGVRVKLAGGREGKSSSSTPRSADLGITFRLNSPERIYMPCSARSAQGL